MLPILEFGRTRPCEEGSSARGAQVFPAAALFHCSFKMEKCAKPKGAEEPLWTWTLHALMGLAASNVVQLRIPVQTGLLSDKVLYYFIFNNRFLKFLFLTEAKCFTQQMPQTV